MIQVNSKDSFFILFWIFSNKADSTEFFISSFVKSKSFLNPVAFSFNLLPSFISSDTILQNFVFVNNFSSLVSLNILTITSFDSFASSSPALNKIILKVNMNLNIISLIL